MRRQEFEKLVLDALADLPPKFQQHLDNLDIVVEWRPGPRELDHAAAARGETLFGLYLGVPLTERGGYNMALPDQIVVYQETHELSCADRQEIVEQVRKTVLHEIGHYLGIDEDRLEELDLG